MHSQTQMPDLVPVLSRGRHRNPRKGACFMEMASYLAGERWSDHPACTHPLLAALARLVNDFSSDAARNRLAPLIPDTCVRVAESGVAGPADAVRYAAEGAGAVLVGEALVRDGDPRRAAYDLVAAGAQR